MQRQWMRRTLHRWHHKILRKKRFDLKRDLTSLDRRRMAQALTVWSGVIHDRKARRARGQETSRWVMMNVRARSAISQWVAWVPYQRSKHDRWLGLRGLYRARLVGQMLFQWRQAARIISRHKRWALLAAKKRRRRQLSHVLEKFVYHSMMSKCHREARQIGDSLHHNTAMRLGLGKLQRAVQSRLRTRMGLDLAQRVWRRSQLARGLSIYHQWYLQGKAHVVRGDGYWYRNARRRALR